MTEAARKSVAAKISKKREKLMIKLGSKDFLSKIKNIRSNVQRLFMSKSERKNRFAKRHSRPYKKRLVV